MGGSRSGKEISTVCPALLLVIAAVCGEGLQDNNELPTRGFWPWHSSREVNTAIFNSQVRKWTLKGKRTCFYTTGEKVNQNSNPGLSPDSQIFLTRYVSENKTRQSRWLMLLSRGRKGAGMIHMPEDKPHGRGKWVVVRCLTIQTHSRETRLQDSSRWRLFTLDRNEYLHLLVTRKHLNKWINKHLKNLASPSRTNNQITAFITEMATQSRGTSIYKQLDFSIRVHPCPCYFQLGTEYARKANFIAWMSEVNCLI